MIQFLLDQAHPDRRTVEAVAKLLDMAAADGVVDVQGTLFGQAARLAGGARRLETVLRLLGANAAIEREGATTTGAWVRLLATESRVRAELEREPTARLLLQSVRAAIDPAPPHQWHPMPPEDALPAIAASDRARLLDNLKERGFLDWRPHGMGSRFRLLEGFHTPDRGIDWKREAAKHKADLEKLRKMQAYAYQSGCRRRYVLDYFGEKAPWRCGRCDRCLAPPNRILPGWPAPRRRPGRK